MVENKHCFYDDSDDDTPEAADNHQFGKQEDTPPSQGREPKQEGGTPTVADEEENIEASLEKRITKASGVASAILGFLIGGPLVGILAGVGIAHAATQQGPMGDIARALGELAIEAKEKWHQLDSKHNIKEASKAAAKQALERAIDLDRRYEVMLNLQKYLILGFNMTLEWIQRHQLVERGVRCFYSAIACATAWVSDEATSRRHRSSENSSNT